MLSLIPLIIVSTNHSGAPAQASIWNEMGIKRTGGNGYEDYLDAIDEFRRARIEPLLEERARPQRMEPSDLEICRIIAGKMEPVSNLIRRGNSRAVAEPVEHLGIRTPLPQYAPFRLINRAMCATSDSRFASGATSAATSELLAAIEFSDNVSRGPLIGGLVGAANQTLVLASFSRRLDQLAIADAEAIERYVNAYFSKPNAVAQSFQRELTLTSALIRTELVRMSPKEIRETFKGVGGENEVDDLVEQWTSMSSSSRSNLCESSARVVDGLKVAIVEMLAKPEREWKPIEVKAVGFEKLLLDVVLADLGPVLDAMAKVRTRMRLLRIHAKIRKFRLEHDRLPESLERLKSETAILDPLTGQRFSYTPTEPLRYELFSNGSATTGRIALTGSGPVD